MTRQGRAVGIGIVVGLLALAPATASAADITVVAGNGDSAFAGDGGPATQASLFGPTGVAPLSSGGYYIADRENHRVRFVSADGTITTVAGNGTDTRSGDNGPATAAGIDSPTAVAPMPDGSFLICDERDRTIRRVGSDGIITTVAGTGSGGSGGDGGPATSAQLNNPHDVVADGDGYLITDTAGARIRRVDAVGTITTVAGGGMADPGDGGAATAAALSSPVGVAPVPGGGYLITERDKERIRLVAADGTISTVAGNGTAGFSGDGGPATAAQLHSPYAATPLPGGGFLIADRDNGRVRQVAADGTISTVAGGGAIGANPPGPATGVSLGQITDVEAISGGFLLVDNSGARVLKVADSTAPPPGDTTKPVLTNLKLSPGSLKPGKGADVSFNLSEAATVTFKIEQSKTGRKKGSRCVKQTHKNKKKKRCQYFVTLAGKFTAAGTAGANKTHFSGKLAGKKLQKSSTYRLVATPVDAAGNKGAAVRRSFRVNKG